MGVGQTHQGLREGGRHEALSKVSKRPFFAEQYVFVVIADIASACSTIIRLFDKCPQAKLLFGFPIDIDVDSPELLQSKRFIAQAIYFWNMIDTSLNMLGPDIELLTEIMTELGTKHVVYGVKPEMFPIMGDALIWTLKEMLGDKFQDENEKAWKETYDALSSDMIRAMVKK